MNVLVTGGAGFIGSHLVDSLLKENSVKVVDNLINGKLEYVNPRAEFVKADLFTDDLDDIFKNQDIVYHIGANPDVRIGADDTRVHINQNILVTYRVLETMRKQNVKKIIFTSSSTIYGEAPTPTAENFGPLKPASLYGASKLACEALISSYCYTFDLQAWIFRLANVIGPRSNHGVIFDFTNKLKNRPKELEILGDGKQKKSYIYVEDCVSGILFAAARTREKVGIFNIGTDDQMTVREIAEMVAEEMKLNPEFKFTGGDRGWKGDVPVMELSTSKIGALGWKAKLTSQEAVRATIREILA